MSNCSSKVKTKCLMKTLSLLIISYMKSNIGYPISEVSEIALRDLL